ncbi:MAG: hypothetical protein K6U09_10010 [Acidobacteriia bacterium]|nr:hypothetical protein [Terriglobia bacterium]
MPRRVVIRRWSPSREPISWTTCYLIENPARMAEIAAVKLARELAGVGCGCHSVAELQGLLRDLGVEVEIVEGEPEHGRKGIVN